MGDEARLKSPPIPEPAAPQQPLSDERHTSNQTEDTSVTAAAGGARAENNNTNNGTNNDNNNGGTNEQDVEFTFTGGHLRDTTEYAERPVLDIEDTHLTFAADSDRSIDEEREGEEEEQRGRSQYGRFGPSSAQQHQRQVQGLSREVLSRLEATRPKSRALVGDWLSGPTQYQVDPMAAAAEAGPSSGPRFAAPDPQEQMRVLGVNTKMSTQHPCSNCERVFNNKSELRHHARRYEKRPYNCDQCERAFLYPKDLRRHKTTHSGSKQYRCSSCPKSFSRKDNLRRHSNNEHGAGGAPRSPSVDAIHHPRGRRRDPSEDSEGGFDPRGTAQGALAFGRNEQGKQGAAASEGRTGSPSNTGGGNTGRQGQTAAVLVLKDSGNNNTNNNDNENENDNRIDDSSAAAAALRSSTTANRPPAYDEDAMDTSSSTAGDEHNEGKSAPTVTTGMTSAASRDSLVDSVMQGRLLPPLVANKAADEAGAAVQAQQEQRKSLDALLLKPLAAAEASNAAGAGKSISEKEKQALIETANKALLPSVRDILRNSSDQAATAATAPTLVTVVGGSSSRAEAER